MFFYLSPNEYIIKIKTKHLFTKVRDTVPFEKMMKEKYGEEGGGRRKEENGKGRGEFRGMDKIYGRVCGEKVWGGRNIRREV